MNNIINLNLVPHTYTHRTEDNFNLVTYVVKKTDLNLLGIKPNLTKHDHPIYTLVIDNIEYKCRSLGALTIPNTVSIIGRQYWFGHWYHKNLLNIIDN